MEHHHHHQLAALSMMNRSNELHTPFHEITAMLRLNATSGNDQQSGGTRQESIYHPAAPPPPLPQPPPPQHATQHHTQQQTPSSLLLSSSTTHLATPTSTSTTSSANALPHKCHLCSMSFSKESGLKRHMKVHRPRVPPSTPLTPASAACIPTPQGISATSLPQHQVPTLSTSATQQQHPFMCNICRMILGSAIELRYHISVQHCWNTPAGSSSSSSNATGGGGTTAAGAATAASVEKCIECGCFRPVTTQCSTNPFRCEPCTFHYQVRTGRIATQQPAQNVAQQQTHQYQQPQQQQQQQHSQHQQQQLHPPSINTYSNSHLPQSHEQQRFVSIYKVNKIYRLL